jgi:hypothetical protein
LVYGVGKMLAQEEAKLLDLLSPQDLHRHKSEN